MKKLYAFLFTIAISSFSFSQSVVITTVVDGTLTDGGCNGGGGSSHPKIVELYVSGTVDFTGYKFQTESNGAADESAISWNTGTDLTSLGVITDSFIYLIGSGDVTFSEMYPSITLPTGLTSLPNGNGNDAYRVFDGTNVIDQFGNPLDITSSNDYSAIWAYQDSYAKRNNGVVANGGNFDPNSFTYGGVGAFVAPNNTCEFIIDAIGLGGFAMSIKDNNISGLKVYPNPVTNGTLYIATDANAEKTVHIYDILGKQVLNTVTSSESVNVSALNSGVYMVKITEEGKTATRKLVVQ